MRSLPALTARLWPREQSQDHQVMGRSSGKNTATLNGHADDVLSVVF